MTVATHANELEFFNSVAYNGGVSGIFWRKNFENQ